MEEDAYGLKWEAEDDRSAKETPWEQEGAAFPVDLFRSWMEVMTRPGQFFRSLNPDIPLARPLIFYVTLVVLGSASSTLSWLAFPGDEAVRPYIWLIFFLSPFTALLSLLVNVGIIHLGVRIFVPNGRPIGVTARTLTYTMAPAVLAIVPWIGWLISGLWSLTLTVIGIKSTHQTSLGRACAAVLVPTLTFLVGLTILAFVIGIFLAIAIGSAA